LYIAQTAALKSFERLTNSAALKIPPLSPQLPALRRKGKEERHETHESVTVVNSSKRSNAEITENKPFRNIDRVAKVKTEGLSKEGQVWRRGMREDDVVIHNRKQEVEKRGDFR